MREILCRWVIWEKKATQNLSSSMDEEEERSNRSWNCILKKIKK